jgi:hypothetical protein
MFDMRAQPVLDVVVESRETIYELPNPEPDGNEPRCAILVRTDVPKISTMYDPGCGQVTPVWTEVRSVMWTDSS